MSTGAFRLQFDNPEETALVRDSIATFEQLNERYPDIGLTKQGYLFVVTTEAAVQRQQRIVADQRQWGVDDVEFFDGDTARRRFAYLAPTVLAARYRAQDGWLSPRRAALALAEESGAKVFESAAVTGFVQHGRVTALKTSRGIVEADAIVLAAGPLTAPVARLAGIDLPIEAVRRQKLVLPNVPEVPRWAPMTIDAETGAHWRPALNGAFGLWTAPAPSEPPAEDVTPTAEFAFGLLNPASDHALARVTPFWSALWKQPQLEWWVQAGQYDYTPDHRPLLGESSMPGLYINSGYSGHGIMTGLGGSRLVIECILGRLQPNENPFRPDRVMTPRAFDVL